MNTIIVTLADTFFVGQSLYDITTDLKVRAIMSTTRFLDVFFPLAT